MQMLAEEYWVGDTVTLVIQSVSEETECQKAEPIDLDPTLTISAKIKQADDTYILVSVTPDPDQGVNKGVIHVVSEPLTLQGLSRIQFFYDYDTVPPVHRGGDILGFYVGEVL